MKIVFLQTAEIVIISQSKDSLKGEVLIGVFDDTCYILIGLLVLVMVFFIWTSLQIEKYQNLTSNRPTFIQVVKP